MLQKSNTLIISLCWVSLVVVCGLAGGFIADSNSSGGEQKLLTYVAYSIIVALVGVAIINLGAVLFDPSNDFKTRVLRVCLFIVPVTLLYPTVRRTITTQYDLVERTRYVGSNKIDVKIEYYSNSGKPGIVRSESFWRNGKKDSIWTIYEKSGRVKKTIQY